MSDLDYWMKRYPENEWAEPTAATVGGKTGYVCRVCVAQMGLRGSDSDRVFDSYEEAYRHIEREHGGSRSDGERAESRDIYEQEEGSDG